MSGVFGVISDKYRTGTGDLLKAMGGEMTHRPWYQVDIFSDEETGVGLGRIGIGIFNPGMQPAVSEDNSILLFLAGEFYEYAGLRSELERKGYHFRDFSDAEFALRLYQDSGPEFVKLVEGIFITAIWDRARRQLFIHDRRMILNFILSSNSHIENRCPFDDYRLVEWAASLPMELKADSQIHSSILSHVAPRLALVPYDRPYRLPTNNQLLWGIHAMYTRTVYALGKQLKIGSPRPTLYADYENYLRYELRDWAEAILFDERTLARGIFRPEALRSLMDRHLSRREEWTIGKIAPLITFEMMMRRFFDESTV